MIKTKVEIPIYDQVVYIYIVDSIRDSYHTSPTLRKLIKKENCDWDGDSELSGLILEVARFAILLKIDTLDDELISHEVFHITKAILKHTSIGPTLTDKNEETWAYLNGWLNKEVRKKLKQLGVPY